MTILNPWSVVTRAVLSALIMGIITGCATAPSQSPGHEADPFEKVNRGVYAFNDTLDRALLKPVAHAYKKVVPKPAARGVKNALQNFTSPIDIGNNFLQGKVSYGFSGIGRLLLNSTVGLAGLFDPATRMGLERHPEDFGQTLAVWGVPQGPYLVLPFLGSSTVTDTTGMIGDIGLDPTYYLDDSTARAALIALRTVDTRVDLLVVEKTIADSLDPYAFIREAYLQQRRYQRYDGDLPDEDLYEDFEDYEDAPAVP